jgi:serine protease Do
MGLSFAIPIDVALSVVDQIKGQGYVSRGWLGVVIQEVTRELAESMSMKKPEGALVSQLLPESPAEAAGLQVGDVIVEFNGRAVSRSSSLPPIVGMTPVGSDAKVKVVRDGKAITLTIRLGELPAEEALQKVGQPKPAAVGERLGLQVTEMTADLRKRSGVEASGVFVAEVGSGPARAAGLRRGDIILKINNQDVDGVEQFTEVVDSLPVGKYIRIYVQRGRTPTFLTMKIEDEQ